MKELSIEEKAKAYDKALEAIKSLQEANPSDEGIQNWVKDNFPELKESEDERNIKDLIDELKCSLRAANCQNDACGGGHEKRIALLEWSIAWLERQGEQKSAWSKEDEEHIMAIDLAVNRCLGKWHCCGEKCPIFEHNPWLKSLKERVQPQHKQGWNEEDEKILSDIIKDLVHPWNEYIPDRIEDEIKWLKNRLKPLKDRVQPNQEWSEEDEYCRHQLIVFCENCMVKDEGAKKCANWLKSLKQRYTWKPSDEQMKCISDVVADAKYRNNISTNGYEPYTHLSTLLQQLKKLKG